MTNKALLTLALVPCVWLAAGPVEARAGGRPPFAELRKQMVDREIAAAGVKDPRVLAAMRATPRHEFMPQAQRKYAYLDMGLAIGHGQTISAPFVVAYMTEQLDPKPTDKVLEIGTGSGYQAAVLSGLVRDVYTIEIVEPLGRRAAKTLRRLHYDNVHAKVGDGFKGWPQYAPFDKIIVTCSPEKVPPALAAQLKEGGKMIIPVGQRYQQVIYLATKTGGRLTYESLLPTLFVPMTGEAERRRRVKPDPTNPEIENGDFEQFSGQPDKPIGWHYQRQLELVTAENAPSGRHFVKFANADPGRGCRALQGFGVDGRKVRQIEVSLRVRGKEIRPGQSYRQMPVLAISFFDERRARVGEGVMGPWFGSFSWQRESALISVPPQAREAILRIGLFGAVGQISFDAIELKPAKK